MLIGYKKPVDLSCLAKLFFFIFLFHNMGAQVFTCIENRNIQGCQCTQPLQRTLHSLFHFLLKSSVNFGEKIRITLLAVVSMQSGD